MSADNVTPITSAYLARLDAGLLAGLRAAIGFRTTYLPITPEELAAVFRAIDERDALKAAASAPATLRLLPFCDCGSVDKYGDDIGEHGPRCPYHIAVIALSPFVSPSDLDDVCKRTLRAIGSRA